MQFEFKYYNQCKYFEDIVAVFKEHHLVQKIQNS